MRIWSVNPVTRRYPPLRVMWHVLQVALIGVSATPFLFTLVCFLGLSTAKRVIEALNAAL